MTVLEGVDDSGEPVSEVHGTDPGRGRTRETEVGWSRRLRTWTPRSDLIKEGPNSVVRYGSREGLVGTHVHITQR